MLWDGTVVPCCLDHEGDIPLGNLYDGSLEDILSSPRARAIYNGFSQAGPPRSCAAGAAIAAASPNDRRPLEKQDFLRFFYGLSPCQHRKNAV